MDKRLLKSLVTAKARYETQRDEAIIRLKAVNEAIASLLASESPKSSSPTDTTNTAESKETLPDFLKK